MVWKLAQSPRVEAVYAAPGNAGTAQIGHNLDIAATDIKSLVGAVQEKGIGLTVVGPEAPLAAGIVDIFRGQGLPIFGPTRAAADLEASKVFAKDLMQSYGIPCARSASFSSFAEAREYVMKTPAPLVVKADGLAAGKGVSVAATSEEALVALSSMMEARVFGTAGDRVVIEEYLTGREVSALAFTDGSSVSPMVPACDYKPVFDGNKGPNTGGMGSYSPPGFYPPQLVREVRTTIMEPAVKAMAREGKLYQGVLYCGLMITGTGPKVLEFNARFGDPETQVILPRLKTDLVDILLAVTNGSLGRLTIDWNDDACVGVVMASGGYPSKYRTGLPISGLDNIDDGTLVFHAGTRLGEKPGKVLTSGGRVLTVVATGKTVSAAREKVYHNLPRISVAGCHYRKDIALREGL